MEQSKIVATTNDKKTEYGHGEIHEFNSQEVLVKSVQKLFLFWGLALLSVFLPVVHFVLVPLFLVLGVFFSVRAFKFRRVMKSGDVACPRRHPDAIGRAMGDAREVVQPAEWVCGRVGRRTPGRQHSFIGRRLHESSFPPARE